MTIHDHLQQFAGLPVHQFSPDQPLPTPPNVAVRIAIDWEAHEEGQTFEEVFSALLNDPASGEIRALIIGDWGAAGEGNNSEAVVEALVSARDKLPNLRALFLGEMTMEESEISWIIQSDVSPIFAAFPQLETFYIRGGESLSLGRPQHESLRELVIETGGMSREIVREVTAARLPALVHLELWLGDSAYGNDIEPEDIEALLSDGPVANLQYLGLRDDIHADVTARVVAEKGIPGSVEVLDLSLGTLTDEGAQALAGCDWLKSLKKLDVHFHYISPPVIEQLKAIVPEVDASNVQEADNYDGEIYRYVAVSE